MEGPPSERAATPDFDAGGTHEGAVTPQPFPIAESGELKMMPPSTGLPVESASWGTSQPATETVETAAVEAPETTAGMSSEEPAAKTHTAAETHTEQTHA
jgi:sec-independent protein translocase protein TatB